MLTKNEIYTLHKDIVPSTYIAIESRNLIKFPDFMYKIVEFNRIPVCNIHYISHKDVLCLLKTFNLKN